jgi:hypothetical protein
MAKAFASVPPEVNTKSRPRAPKRAAMASRASSNTRRAARPSAWTEDGLPGKASASAIAAMASGRIGSVALASK